MPPSSDNSSSPPTATAPHDHEQSPIAPWPYQQVDRTGSQKRGHRCQTAQLPQRLGRLLLLYGHQHYGVVAGVEEVKAEAHHHRAKQQERGIGRLPGHKRANAQQNDAQGHDADFGQKEGQDANQKAHQPWQLTQRLDPADAPRPNPHLLHDKVVEHRLPDAEAKVQHEIGNDQVDHYATVFSQHVTHVLVSLPLFESKSLLGEELQANIYHPSLIKGASIL